MATSSIFHNVIIKDEDSLKTFVKAVEASKNTAPNPVKISKPVVRGNSEWVKDNLTKCIDV